uniref:S-acyltransferase n=1 Tax=Cannabis sativa TaxID=3483 RepID=A0A803PUI3_CANSA
MLQLQNQRRRENLAWPSLIARCFVSCNMVLLTYFALSLVTRFFSNSSSLLLQLSLSALVLLLVMGLGGWFRRLLGIHASAPAFVFFNILFIWCFYVFIIRKGVSLFMDILFNGEVAMLIFGLCSMLKSDPGVVRHVPSFSDKPTEGSVDELNNLDEDLELLASGLSHESAEDSILERRVRYCRNCTAYIKGFDHHCPAFGNCIGQKNYLVFMALLLGFIVTEASFLACSSDYTISRIHSSEASLSERLAVSLRIFAILQLVWKVPFLTWHAYCICFNIRTDEWINWNKYPEFQLIMQHQPGHGSTEVWFTNPYDKGILHNVKEFLSSKG